MPYRRNIGVRSAVALACLALWSAGTAAHAQLQVTEIMSNPVSDAAWEWIEVRNTGAAAIDLDGYIIDRLGDALPTMINPGVQGSLTANTVVPAGGVAVLYDADVPIDAADYDDSKFRAAWGLSASVPLIGVAGGFSGGLTNDGGAAIGFWADEASYIADAFDDGMGAYRVAQFDNAAFNIDFRTDSGFPAADNGVSLRWSGSGTFQDGAQWAATASGVTSAAVTVPGSTNSTSDVGNPGLVPGGQPPFGSLLFTEIMYNPNSDEPEWEWIEIYNNTGAAIDFGATPYVFDDVANDPLEAPNLTSGVIPHGAAAVLFNASDGGITLTDMQAAWDPTGTREINFIPVIQWTALNQGGDELGIWSSFADYQSDSPAEGDRTFTSARAFGPYDNEEASDGPVTGVWPNDNNAGSIHLTDLSLDPTVGDNWSLSADQDAIGSFDAAGIAGTITLHPGGDLGTPGAFGASTSETADFDGDSDVDGADFLIWQRNLGAGTGPSSGDANGSGTVDAADLAVWKAQFDAAATAAVGVVPEPAAVLLAGLAIAACGLAGRAGRAN